MIRVAVVGVGGMGACHARHVHDLAGAEVHWVADPDEAAGRALAVEVGAQWTGDGFVAIDDCDAVVIASPDRFHADQVHAAFDAGLPVLCEKPLTLELADAREILDREVEVGRRLLQLGFMREYDQRHIQVAGALTELGSVNHVRCVHRNRTPQARSLHEVLVQSIIHDIHTLRWLSGSEIVRVMTATVNRDERLRFVLLTCELDNGGVATIEFDDCAAGYEVWVEVSADRGNVVASEPDRAVLRAHRSISSTLDDDWFSPFLEAYRIEMRAWLDSISETVATGPSAWDGYAAQAVLEAALVSDASGRPQAVRLEERPSLYVGPPT